MYTESVQKSKGPAETIKAQLESKSSCKFLGMTGWSALVSFNRQNHQSLTSRRICEKHLKSWKKTSPSWFSQQTKGALTWSRVPTPTELRCLRLLRTDRNSSSTKIRQIVWPASCRKSCLPWSEANIYQRPFTTRSDPDTNSRLESTVYWTYKRPMYR